MNHGAFIRDVPGSPVAVLMIHGIAGTPAHFRDLLPSIPEHFTVHNILLDGHGKTVRDFSLSSMEKWRSQAFQELEQLLESHEKVILIAHSMGTLFAIQAAVKYPARIPSMLLLNIPTRPRVRPSTVPVYLRVNRGNLRIDDIPAWDLYHSTSIYLEKQLWKYLSWTPRGAELLLEIRKTRQLLPQLQVPTQAFHSQKDELVSNRSKKDLTGHPCIQLHQLSQSGHFRYTPEDTQKILQVLKEMLQTL